MYMPFAAAPAPSMVAEIGVKPSGPMIVDVRPEPARRSLISLPPLLQMIPPRKMPSAPEALMRLASAS